MLRIVCYLIYIFWRKFFVKDDFLALGIIFFIFIFLLGGIFQTYEKNYYLLFFFFLLPLSHHIGRGDFSLLKSLPKWRIIIFLEYLVNSIPILFIFCIKTDFYYGLSYVIALIFLVFIPQFNQKVSFPFHIFNPFWIISFRRYRLFLTFPFVLALIVIAKMYNNENLVLFSLFLIAILSIIPYFEREYIAHILFSSFRGKLFLHKQIINGLINYTYLFLPFMVLTFICFSWKMMIFSVLFFIFPLLGIFTKYTFFESPLKQSVFYVLILLGYSFGLPFICLPFLYYGAVNKVKKIQNVTD